MLRYLYNLNRQVPEQFFRREWDTLDEENAALAEQFLRAEKLFENYRSSRSKMLDPHRGQGRVLAILRENPEISQKKLSFLLDMRNQSLSELLAKLEKAGLVTRVPSEEDRRSMNVKLTREGEALAKKTEETQTDSSRIFDCLSENDRRRLLDILDHLTDELECQLGYAEEDGHSRHRSDHRHHDGRHHRAEPAGEKPAPRDNITEIRKAI